MSENDAALDPPGENIQICVVRNNKPTTEQWGAYQHAWGWFNERLFDGELDPCILNFSRKSNRTMGFFAPNRWAKGEASVPEISLNPDHLLRPLADTMLPKGS